LEKLGFTWNTLEARWDSAFQELKAYVKAHGHADIPQTSTAHHKLATWAVSQRQMKRLGKLPSSRIKQLDSLGFQWQPHVSTWRQRFSSLAALKKDGQPWNPPKDPKLAKWLKHQKHFLKAEMLSPHRERQIRTLLSDES
jgi:hypothetical protein